jgi:hypothetical protein
MNFTPKNDRSALITALASGSVNRLLALYAPAASISLLLLLFWIATVSDSWVRIPADAYAGRLFEAVDVLLRQNPDPD